jgi:hypothetical protein
MVGTLAEFGLIAPIAFGNALIRLVNLIGIGTLTVLFFISIEVNKRSDDTHTDHLVKGLQQLQTLSSLAANVRKCAKRSDQSDTRHGTGSLFLTR